MHFSCTVYTFKNILKIGSIVLYTFKNYFTIIFSVFNKINCIQMDLKC